MHTVARMTGGGFTGSRVADDLLARDGNRVRAIVELGRDPERDRQRFAP